ncbi:chemotaxis-specific protein-glutamate methyltransferase CheB [Thiocapsa bogorovii]|uniref:chemotaxis-specific protein-glutamate methyltransferase CheB n=1 Tax=Thiocapsa bogorovii TaxID=521689 RepID=UPI001E4A7AA9|nr:chemotaxis-specific protein-glutamate methyltransferase CheB [Thiocapsa bogorovii]UHD14817.1 chemotaxis-specific protein-glutamate methyltransferase CheB [Thiocapsa bogorovii]
MTEHSRPPVRVLVVDDSRSARSLIRALIETAPGLVVCGEAADGREAVEKTLALKPDVVTMDLQMPEMDGMQAIEEIMSRHAVPILVLSDLADAANAMAAVARGALEAARKPTFDEGAGLASRLRILARIPVIRHIRRNGALVVKDVPDDPTLSAWPETRRDTPPSRPGSPVVAIASSTGGPQALARILPDLPADFAAPVLIAQHISDGFAVAMADWLDQLCALPVKIPVEGEALLPGRVYIADSITHMTLGAGRRIRLEQRAESDVYRPSCDRLLTSVAAQVGRDAVGVILTGMGRDGAQGMLALAKAGGTTIAQDEATSVIFGMNREAILAGGVQLTLPLDLIADKLCMLAGCGAAIGAGVA